MAGTKIITMTGFVEWAKIFEGNMDNSDFHAETEGQFNMNFYPESEKELKKFFDAGAPESSMGNDTIKLGNAELAMGKYIKLKRPNKHKGGIEAFGGAPKVYNHTEGESTKLWDLEEDGPLGNGSKVKVKVSIFGSGPRASIRLERVAVLNCVVYVGRTDEEEGF